LKQINIKNIHPDFKIKKRALEILMKNILTAENEDTSVDLILVDDEFMQRLNRKFIGRNRTTDVISFGMKEGKPETVEFPNLGDIYVSLDQAKRQAEEYGNKFEEELRLLVAHGLLHLLGYDHRNKKEEAVMRKKEGIYLKSAKNI
jgi:probable rRNA maturation factor